VKRLLHLLISLSQHYCMSTMLHLSPPPPPPPPPHKKKLVIFYVPPRYVKLSSPYVNIMIVVGAIMFYVIVILFGVDENTASFDTVDRLCHTRIWLCVFAFTLLCGTIIAKTYKIFYIFRHTKPNFTPVSKIIFLF